MNVPGIPGEVQDAIRAGQAGLALLLGPADTDPVRLLCAAPADRLSAISTVGLAVGVGGVSGGGLRDRLVVLQVGAVSDGAAGRRWPADAELRVGIDLGYPEGRELAARLVHHRGLLLYRVATRSGRLLDPVRITFSAAHADALRSALARAGEWHTEPPPPIGLSDDQWRRLVADGAGPRLAALPGADGMVVAIVPAPAFQGVDLSRRRPVVVGPSAEPPMAPPWPHADLELRFAAPAGEAVRLTLSLRDDDQRRLAARLADQAGLIVFCLGTDASRSITGCVRLELSPRTRSLVRCATGAGQRAGNR